MALFEGTYIWMKQLTGSTTDSATAPAVWCRIVLVQTLLPSSSGP